MRNVFPLLLAGLALFVPLSVPMAASAQTSAPGPVGNAPRYVQTQLIPEFTSIKPGGTFAIAIDQSIAEHWHTYWKNPGDSGEAITVKWTLPDGFTAGELQWPTPSRMPIGPLLNFGYSTRVSFLTDITAPETITADKVDIKAEIAWLVCEEICIPESTTISISVPVGDQSEASSSDVFAAARASIPEQVTWPGVLSEQDGALLLSFTPDDEAQLAALQQAKTIEFFPDEWGVILNASSQENKVEDGAVTLRLQRDTSRPLSELAEITGILAYTDASGARHGKYVQVPVPATPAAVEKLAAEKLSGATSAPSVSLWQALGWAFLGGLVLNLMPCVFPVLSMKALSLVKMSAREQAHAVTHGVMYTLGILLCFGLIAGVLITLQHAGSQIGWGFQLQNPIVVLLLAYLLFIIGLNLSGVFEVGSSGLTNLGSKLTQKRGYAGSFFTGMLATIVATPCTAPFMGAAMGYAVTQPAFVAFSVFASLGFGLAFPYLMLTIVPALRNALPKPGPWMQTFREFLAFPMYASTAWLIWVYGQQIDGVYGILLAGLGVVFIAMGIWLWKHAPSRHPAQAMVKLLAILSVATAIAIVALSMKRAPLAVSDAAGTQPSAMQHSGNWSPYSPAALEEALKGNDPVFVNMTASWCITCKVNERVALATDDTIALFEKNKVLYLIGDWTNEDPDITAYLSKHGRNGVPLYVYYGSRDLTTNTRPDPVVLPQLLSPGLIEDIVTYN